MKTATSRDEYPAIHTWNYITVEEIVGRSLYGLPAT
jgi:hypothetical protein